MSLRHTVHVLNRYHLSPSLKVVLWALADSANDQDDTAWLSVPNIAAKACISERQVQRNVAELVADGYLDELGPHPEPRYRGVMVYRVRLDVAQPQPAQLEQSPDADAAAVEPAQSARGDRMSPQPRVTGDTGVAVPVTSTTARGDTGVTQSPREPFDNPGTARARAIPPPPGEQPVEDPEARRTGNRRRFVAFLRDLVVASERDVEIDEWAGVAREAGARSFDELVAAVTWCVRAARRAGAKVRWPSDAIGFAPSCRGWLRSQRDAAARQAEITDPEPADAGDGA